MARVELRPWQTDALERLSNGKILRGGVGSGKSLVALAYYYEKEQIGDLIIITTAKKRDSLEWEGDAAKFGIGRKRGATTAGTITVDSWNNIGKYVDRTGCFFIFDEQRLVGNGAWVKSFHKIVKNGNAWIILSATPGDTWMDYIPVFVANGYYRNATHFKLEHVVYAPYSRYPKILRYLNETKLRRLKASVLVEMPYESFAQRHLIDVDVEFDQELFDLANKRLWNPFEDRPIRDAAEMFAILRKIVYSDRSRLDAIRTLMEHHPKLIVFYNYNYELDLLRELNDSLTDFVAVAEWNGHKKQPIPDTDRWVYLVQYTAGAEGWNCIATDAMAFYSLTYSYKQFEQAQGRIDRMNTPFHDLWYYAFSARISVDDNVKASLERKEDFNERLWMDANLPDFDSVLDELEGDRHEY